MLLIDVDVLKLNIFCMLEFKFRKGLMEYLMGDVEDIFDVLYYINVDKLKFIFVGKFYYLFIEMFVSYKMYEIVDEFVNRYFDCIVIFDILFLIGINESVILVNFVG